MDFAERARECFVCGGEGGFRWMEGHPDGEYGENGTSCPLCAGTGILPKDFQPSLSALLASTAREAAERERERCASIAGKAAERARLGQMLQNAMLKEAVVPSEHEVCLKAITHAVAATAQELAAAIRKGE